MLWPSRIVPEISWLRDTRTKYEDGVTESTRSCDFERVLYVPHAHPIALHEHTDDVEAIRFLRPTMTVDPDLSGLRLFLLLSPIDRFDRLPESIAATQTSNLHLYQRPDASDIHYDPTRRSLDGFGLTWQAGRLGATEH